MSKTGMAGDGEASMRVTRADNNGYVAGMTKIKK